MQTFLGLVVWVVLSEIFPMTIRGFAMGVATFALWTANTIISFVFPILAEALGSTGTFAIFADQRGRVLVHRQVGPGDTGSHAGGA